LEIDATRKKYTKPLCLVSFYDKDNDKVLKFLTNNFKFAASTIAKTYKARWDIEKFFRWIKQNLKMKTFCGASKNAVMLQIWAAMIYYLLLHFIKFQTKSAWEILELSRRIQALLLDNRSFLDLLSKNFTNKPKPYNYVVQLNLF